jgi:hypothetical protein
VDLAAAERLLDAPPAGHHVVAVMLGKAPAQGARLYRQPAWANLAAAVGPFVETHPWARLTSVQNRVEALGARRADGTQRVRFHAIPGLKARPWNPKALADIHAHLETGDDSVTHQSTFVLAGAAKDAAKGHDFYFAFRTHASLPTSHWDQLVHLALSARAVTSMGKARVLALLEAVADLSHALKAGLTSRPWRVATPTGSVTHLDVLMDATYAHFHDSLELRRNPYAEWITLR